MYAPERQQAILGLARSDGRVDVNSLADTFDVTPETIRRDLTEPGAARRAAPGARRRHPGRAARAWSWPVDQRFGHERRAEGADRQGRARPAARRRLDHHRRRHHHRPVRRHPARRPAASPSSRTPCRSPRLLAERPNITLHLIGGQVRPGHPGRRRQLGRARVRRGVRRRRVRRHQRDQRGPRADHPGHRRGGGQAGADARRPAAPSCWPTTASSAATSLPRWPTSPRSTRSSPTARWMPTWPERSKTRDRRWCAHDRTRRARRPRLRSSPSPPTRAWTTRSRSTSWNAARCSAPATRWSRPAARASTSPGRWPSTATRPPPSCRPATTPSG